MPRPGAKYGAPFSRSTAETVGPTQRAMTYGAERLRPERPHVSHKVVAVPRSAPDQERKVCDSTV
jgi:hypothetical protein